MSDTTKIIDLSNHPRLHGGQAASPFRYPGGKGFLTPFLTEELRRRFFDRKPQFAEPYCGGAGAALLLLRENLVQSVHLNDADARVYSAWRAITCETDRFCTAIEHTVPSIENWERYLKVVCDATQNEYSFELGFATFFINRTSRSGVVIGSGPIGGYDQSGKWKIDARYYREALIRRVQTLGSLKEKIHLTNMDGLEFCRRLQLEGALAETFLFIDPPYVKAGGRLYHDGMSIAKHDALAVWLTGGNAPHWLLTYDDHPIIRENYKAMKDHMLDVRYSLSSRRVERELLYMS